MIRPKNKHPKFKVLYILEIFPEISETFILDEILEAQRQGIDVKILSLAYPKSKKNHQETDDLIEITQYLADLNLFQKYIACFVMFIVNPIKLIRFIKYLYGVERYVRDTRDRLLETCYLSLYVLFRRIDHMHAHFANKSTSYAMWVHMLTDTPYTFTSHGYDIFYVVPTDMKQKTKLSKAHIVVSNYNKNYLEQKLGLNKDKIKLNYVGINTDIFSADPSIKKEKLIINVGRLHEVKGQKYLIQACKILKNNNVEFKCRIIGGGEKETELRDLIEKLSLKDLCFLEGEKTRDEVIHYYQKARLFVLSSLSEGIPSVLKESLACGVPVIGTAVGGVPEIIFNGQTGYLAQTESPQDIAEKILKLWDNDDLREKIVQSGRKFVYKNFDLTAQTQNIINIWKN